ncbi:MAG: hypothetical protein WCF12_00870 [Propionicimonas sp.]
MGTIRAYAFDANLPPMRARRTALARAVDALGVAVGAAVRIVGPIGSPWPVICVLSGGRLLAARPRPS